MRTALVRVDAHNPIVEAPRRGYCVEVLSTPAIGYLFACPISEQTHGLCVWVGGGVGFCRPTGPIKIWADLYAAQVAAGKTGGKVVTIPRIVGETSQGPVRVWEDVK